MGNTGLFRLYPLVPLCVSLAAGILAGRSMATMVGMTVWAVAFGVAFTAALLLGGRPKAQTAAILLSVFLLGCAMAALAERRQSVSLPQGETAFEAIVADEPVERGRTLRFDAIACSGPLKGHWVRLTLLKDTAERRYATLGVGDGMLVRSRLVPPANYRESNFDYATYLQSRGIVATTFVYYRNWRKSEPRLSALTVVQRARISAMRLRHWLLGRYRSLGLEGQDFAVVAAMTLGDKSALSGSMREAYSLAGASHILALSGMHLGVIYLLLSMLLSGRRRRLLGECLLLMAIWSYVFIVGMPSSVVRSALMISVYGLVGLTGRSRMSVNALAFAAVVLLVANPLALFDIGFQLSFAAVAFILVFQSSVGSIASVRFLQRHRLLRWAWQLSVMSLLAQIGTAPLVAFYFGRLPVCSLLTGLVVIPAATAIIYLAVALFAVGFVPVLQQAVATVLAFVATWLNAFLLAMASQPWASVGLPRLSPLQVVLLYVVAVCVCSLLAICGRHMESAREWGA